MEEAPKSKDFQICKCNTYDVCHISFCTYILYWSKIINCSFWDMYPSLGKHNNSGVRWKSGVFFWKKPPDSPLSYSCKKSNVTQSEARRASAKLLSWERNRAPSFWGLPSWRTCKILLILDLKQADIFQGQSICSEKQTKILQK